MVRFGPERLLTAVSVFLVAVLCGMACLPVHADESMAQLPTLQQKIDYLVENAAIGPMARQCSDSDFLRRIHLDLTGVIPSAEQLRAFLNETAKDKRARVVDVLLGSIDSSRHLAIQFSVLFLERRTEKNVKQQDWERYLFESVHKDRPLDQIMSELVYSPPFHPASKFLLAREGEPNAMTRDVGRLAFGMDLQCAQCHNHPLIDGYLQEDYYGLFAFLNRTGLFTNPTEKKVQLSEKADGEATFKSVFTGYSREIASPRLPKEYSLLEEPTFSIGDEYRVKPDKNVAGEPKFSRRQALARQLAGSGQFQRNMANRIWAMMFARGIVHPMDFHHEGNSPSNPELLALLAQELKANGFQIRPILRAIALSRTYQRSCEVPAAETVNFADIAARSMKLKAERDQCQTTLAALKKAAEVCEEEYREAIRRYDANAAELAKIAKSVRDAAQKRDTAQSSHLPNAQAVEKIQKQSVLVSEAALKARQASEAIADDKVLAEAASRIAEREASLKSKLKPLIEKAAESKKLVETATADLAREESALASQKSRMNYESLKQVEKAHVAASQTRAKALHDFSRIELQISLCNALLEFQAVQQVDETKANSLWQTVVSHWTTLGQVAPLKPLTPEQMASSAMQAAGIWGKHLKDSMEQVEKSPPESLEKASEGDKLQMKQLLSQLGLVNALRGQVDQFAALYGGLPGEDFQATVNQALFFGNGAVIDGWLKPTDENLTGRLAKIDSSDELADQLYIAVLSRPAIDEERREVRRSLERVDPKADGDRKGAISEWIWALLSSNEFRFNH